MRLTRRSLVEGAAAAIGGRTLGADRITLNLASARYRNRWLHHPVLGDPSWDAFVREPGNPIYTGKRPYEWPVNGYLFRDPVSSRWFVYASVYPRGYWGQPGANTMILREKPGGGWEELGLAFPRDPHAFFGDGVRSGPTTDACVVYWEGVYYALIGWANPSNTRGGLALARASRPEGPFTILAPPIHDDARQKPILGQYVRAYASTLIKRKGDWLILHMMSTPGNAGGTWGLFAMVGSSVEGPYSEPAPLLLPQSDRFHPPLAEFFPAYVAGGRVFAPATSVAKNRTYQSLFSAPVEEAHRASAWRIEQLGSLWHAEPVENEACGIWGQTYSAQIAPGGILRAMFPSKTRFDVGTINMARRHLARPYRDGFTVSAPNAPSRAILWGSSPLCPYLIRIRARSSGPWAVAWQCRDPLGPDRPTADAAAHPLCRTDRVELRVDGGGWMLLRLTKGHPVDNVASGSLEAPLVSLEIAVESSSCSIQSGGARLWEGLLEAQPGRIELIAETGTVLRVDEFSLTSAFAPAWEAWLATEALAGAAAPAGDWLPTSGNHFRYGEGYASARPRARAKWNYAGAGFRLWAPRGPDCGSCRLTVDGRDAGIVDLRAAALTASHPVFGMDLPAGLHAVVVEALEAGAPLDTLEVRPG